MNSTPHLLSRFLLSLGAIIALIIFVISFSSADKPTGPAFTATDAENDVIPPPAQQVH